MKNSFNPPYGVTVGMKGEKPLPTLKYVLADMQEMGLLWLRFQVRWSDVEKTRGKYNFSLWDDAVKRSNDAGRKIYLTIKQAPSFHLTQKSEKGILPSPEGTKRIACAIAERYNGGQYGKLDMLEIGNEDYDWWPSADYKPLVSVMREVYPAVKVIQPNLPIIPAATLQRNSQHIKWFTDGLVKEASDCIDALNMHFYTGLPSFGHFPPDDDSVRNVPSFEQYYKLLQKSASEAGEDNLPILATETGFAINDHYGRKAELICRDQQIQWNYLKHVLDQSRLSGVVKQVYIFTLGYNNEKAQIGVGGSDGMSLFQGIPGTSGSFKTYAYERLKEYIAEYPTWDENPDPDLCTCICTCSYCRNRPR